MTNSGLRHFFNNVTIRLSIYGWSLKLIQNSSEGYCWHQNKTIDVGLNYPNPRQLILHEIAHIWTCRFCNNKHTPVFWKTFEDLVKRFLKESPDTDQQHHKLWMNEGIYSLIYLDKTSLPPVDSKK